MEDHEIDTVYQAAAVRVHKRMALSARDRRDYDVAVATGDWATAAKIMGEDIGTD